MMPGPVTLSTGQWSDLPFETLSQKASDWGYDGLELACWGDHFSIERALGEDGYLRRHRDTLEKYGLGYWAISNHNFGQATCDRIDERHRYTLPAAVWGMGKRTACAPGRSRSTPGRGLLDFEAILRALNHAGYEGPLSVELEDPGMDREQSAREAREFTRRPDARATAREQGVYANSWIPKSCTAGDPGPASHFERKGECKRSNTGNGKGSRNPSK